MFLWLLACHFEQVEQILLLCLHLPFLFHLAANQQLVGQDKYQQGGQNDEHEHEVAVLVRALQAMVVVWQGIILVEVAMEADADIVIIVIEVPVAHGQCCQGNLVA